MYAYTNETLEAIIKGLDVKGSDDILAICGAGDQAFAMLEYGCRVTAVDKEISQAGFVYNRKIMLELENTKEFLKEYIAGHPGRQKNYFRGRIERIRANLGKLAIEHKNIYDMQKIGRFSKAYLSNALGYSKYKGGETAGETKKAGAFLKRLGRQLREPGLIYVASIGYGFNKIETQAGNVRIPANLCIDTELTALAQKLEKGGILGWVPIVMRKKA